MKKLIFIISIIFTFIFNTNVFAANFVFHCDLDVKFTSGINGIWYEKKIWLITRWRQKRQYSDLIL
jgi:hypothetical protein